MIRLTYVAVAAALAAVATAGAAMASQNPPSSDIPNRGGPSAQTPEGWNYEIRDGRRVPKASKRIRNADGSWREEFRQGTCTTVKERTAAGEYREIRSCD